MPDIEWFLRIGMVVVPVLLFALGVYIWGQNIGRDDEHHLPPAE
ncbi:MAG: hypothetical protein FD124_3166 [Alphaproteobacteria bacterium]|nr:MAG: hypothetical protein FD160_3751 [Caulobacteraceae bacterium]TPW03037.1 MAG: hypothetical protein FD124_3166 [Alphaproteobacteria bacterium]